LFTDIKPMFFKPDAHYIVIKAHIWGSTVVYAYIQYPILLIYILSAIK
jgi:hypothetical protein